jgi:hypothetical protein
MKGNCNTYFLVRVQKFLKKGFDTSLGQDMIVVKAATKEAAERKIPRVANMQLIVEAIRQVEPLDYGLNHSDFNNVDMWAV